MTFFAILAAILLEYLHPIDPQRLPKLTRPLQYLGEQFNAGAHKHGIVAWLLAMVPVLIATSAIYFMLASISLWLAWLWNIAVLYLSLRFKASTIAAESINRALTENGLSRAQAIFLKWRGIPNAPKDAKGLLRISIESLFIDSLRRLCAVIFWFAILAPLGPIGAVLYRLTHIIADEWQPIIFGKFAYSAQRMVYILDWLPTRITALSFAIAGNFEDAVYCWRSQATEWGEPNEGILLSSAAGALGVKLGMPVQFVEGEAWRPEIGLGDEVDSNYLNSAISLIWRVLTIWLLILLLIALAKQAG